MRKQFSLPWCDTTKKQSTGLCTNTRLADLIRFCIRIGCYAGTVDRFQRYTLVKQNRINRSVMFHTALAAAHSRRCPAHSSILADTPRRCVFAPFTQTKENTAGYRAWVQKHYLSLIGTVRELVLIVPPSLPPFRVIYIRNVCRYYPAAEVSETVPSTPNRVCTFESRFAIRLYRQHVPGWQSEIRQLCVHTQRAYKIVQHAFLVYDNALSRRTRINL